MLWRIQSSSVALLLLVATVAAAQQATDQAVDQITNAVESPSTDAPRAAPGHALLRVPDPGSKAWILLAAGRLTTADDSLAGLPPTPISDEAIGWVILAGIALFVVALVLVTKTFDSFSSP